MVSSRLFAFILSQVCTIPHYIWNNRQIFMKADMNIISHIPILYI
jgi:hypothetical protein